MEVAAPAAEVAAPAAEVAAPAADLSPQALAVKGLFKKARERREKSGSPPLGGRVVIPPPTSYAEMASKPPSPTEPDEASEAAEDDDSGWVSLKRSPKRSNPAEADGAPAAAEMNEVIHESTSSPSFTKGPQDFVAFQKSLKASA